MKKLYSLHLTALLMGLVWVLAGFGGSDSDNSTGAPAGNTGSPGDGQNCTHCMGGTASQVSGWITSNVPADGYKNDSTYTITVTATGAGNKGFQVSPQDLGGNLLGTLFAGTGSKLVGSGKYVTHSAAKTGASASWTFTWKAPPTGNSDITFYGAIAVTKPVTRLCTMTISKNTVGVDEQQSTEVLAYPNPARDKVGIRMHLDRPGRVRIELIGMNGSLLSVLADENSPAGNFSRSLPLEQGAGVYLLKIRTDNGLFTKKLVVE